MNVNVKSDNVSSWTFVCPSEQPANPGQKDWDKKTSVWSIIKNLATEITTEDPEFLLKVGDFACVSVCRLCCQVVMLSTCMFLHICFGFRLQSILGRN